MNKLVFKLPFVTSYKLKPAMKPITTKKVSLFLGNTFYMRIANIYKNIISAIAQDNWTYLASALDPQIYKELTSQINKIRQNDFKIKMIQGKGTSLGLSKKRKKFMFRQRQWVDQYSKVAVQCKVIFGQQWNKIQAVKTSKKSFNDGHKNKSNKENLQQLPNRLIRIGSYRMISYNPNINIIQNIENFYYHQTFQFRVRIKSTIQLQIIGLQGEVVSTSFSQSQNQFKQKQITTQLKLKASSQSFNWQIVGINELYGQYNKTL